MFNSGSFISIVSYDICQFATPFNDTEGISDIGFVLVYDKACARIDIRNTLREFKSYSGIRYNKLKSDNTQMCLQSDNVRFVIQNSGETYIVIMYLWHRHNWMKVFAFRGCEIKAGNSYEVPELHYSSAIEKTRDKNAEEVIQSEDAEMVADTYQAVEANSYDGYVSIRQEKSSQSEEVGRLENGYEASYLGTEGDWYKIEYNGVTGFVYNKYAKVVTMIDP